MEKSNQRSLKFIITTTLFLLYAIPFIAIANEGNGELGQLPDAANDNIAPAHQLEIELIKQNTSSWCWMATSMMVIKYKNGEELPRQCEMINEFFNEIMPAQMQTPRSPYPARTTPPPTTSKMASHFAPPAAQRDCCDENNYACKRRTSSTQEMLTLLAVKGMKTQHLNRPLNLEEISQVINSDSPMIAFVRQQRTGHVVVISGVDPEKNSVTIMDPMVGKYEMSVQELTFSRRLGRWVETVVIDPQFQLNPGIGASFPGYRPNCSMFSNPMTSMGMGMFNMMSGMPFFGSGVRRMGSMMASQMMNNPRMAYDMIECAKSNPQMVGTMMKMLQSNRGMLQQIAGLIYHSPAIAESLIDLGLMYQGVAPFFFTNLNPALYHALTYAMSKNPSLTQKMIHLVDEHAPYILRSGTPFWNILMYLGHEDSNSDGGEIPNERFIRAVFSDIKTITHFVKVINKLDKPIRTQMLDFLLLGKRPDEFVYNLRHTNQAYLFAYAMIDGMANSIVDIYDHNDMPNSNSENPANALLGELMIEMVDMESDADVLQLSEYGRTFIAALLFAKDKGNKNAIAVHEMMNQIIPLEIFMDQLPTPTDSTPDPRNLDQLPLFEEQMINGPAHPQRPGPSPTEPRPYWGPRR